MKENFSVVSICRNGYESTGEKTKQTGTILELLEYFFYVELSEVPKDGYIPFIEFIERAKENQIKESYLGDCSIELLADMFTSELRTNDQDLECINKDSNVTKEDVVKYISSLYINEDYIEDYGFNKFCAMR